jgi:predicted DNA-binding protein
MCSFVRFMPSKPNLTKPVSIRLSPSVRKTVKDLSESTGLLQAQVYDLILRAGCKAIEDNQMKFEMPLRFEQKQ